MEKGRRRKRKSGSFGCHVCIISPVLELVVRGERAAAFAKQKQATGATFTGLISGALVADGGNYFRTDSQHWHHISNGMQNNFSVLCYNNAVIMIICRPKLFKRCSQEYF